MMNTAQTDALDEFAVEMFCADDQLFLKWPANVTLTMILKPVV
jgi:hypothetical protein